MKTVLVEKKNMGEIVKCLQEHHVVAFPTETVFGIGTRMDAKEGLQKLYELKHREKNKAITLMVATKEEIPLYAEIGKHCQKVIQAYMPGKITLVLKKRKQENSISNTNQATIGIRIPDDSFVLALLKEVGPMWVTSANISGEENMSCDIEVFKQFNHRVPLIVKGKTNSTVASTVVDMQEDTIKILREGDITKEMLEGVIGCEDCNGV